MTTSNPNCEMCEGTGLVNDVLEGQNQDCLCVVEGREEEKAESLND